MPVVSMQKLVPYAQLVAPLVSIHVVGLPDPYRFPYESVDKQYVIFGCIRVISIVFVST